MNSLLLALAVALPCHTGLAGPWRAALALAGGELRFSLQIADSADRLTGRVCNAGSCGALSGVRQAGDSVRLEIADYAASIAATCSGDTLAGFYRNVGNRGPRVIPFHASRGRWDAAPVPRRLAGRWDATFVSGQRRSPRVLLFEGGPSGLQGTVISNTGDYGTFQGQLDGDSVAMSHFDGSFVYLLTARLDGDTLRGTFHAGLSTQTPFTAVRSTGRDHLRPPTSLTQADTTAPFHFAFPDLNGRMVRNDDPRFRGKVVLIDIFGTWCPTCQEAAPELVRLWHEYHARGLEIAGIAYEVSGDTAIDAALVRRYKARHQIPFPLLLGGTNTVEATAATLPQLTGFTSYPTTIFLGRDGRVRRVHAGFYGASTGPMHQQQVASFRAFIEQLLEEP
jgi:thiol-disulfide isomerase/thioredoxin